MYTFRTLVKSTGTSIFGNCQLGELNQTPFLRLNLYPGLYSTNKQDISQYKGGIVHTHTHTHTHTFKEYYLVRLQHKEKNKQLKRTRTSSTRKFHAHTNCVITGSLQTILFVGAIRNKIVKRQHPYNYMNCSERESDTSQPRNYSCVRACVCVYVCVCKYVCPYVYMYDCV